MRVLHLNGIAGLPQVLAEEQNRRGHHAEVWDFRPHPYGFKAHKIAGVFERFKLLTRFEKWDVIHCHSCSVLPKYFDKFSDLDIKQKVLYHHHGSDVRFRGCPAPNLGRPHLVSTPDLARWCPQALYVPNPIVNAEYAINNEPYIPIQKLPKKSQAEFLKDLQTHDKLVDLPSELLGVASYSAMQAQAMGCKVYERVPFPQEVGHVCDLLDYVYERLL